MSATSPTHPLLHLRQVSKHYTTGAETVVALDDVSLDIHAGEFVAIMGQSGSGKSTLMHILGCLDTPSDGAYRVGGQQISQLTPDQLADVRRNFFGFVFQRYNLLATESAVENVEIPAIYAGTPKAERQERAQGLLARLGIADRAHHRPSELSGGQQQRVSIGRALMNGAPVILADEPTGALDQQSGQEVLKLLEELNASGTTVILITHDAQVASRAHRQIHLSDGRVTHDSGARETRATQNTPIKIADAGYLHFWGSVTEAVRMAFRSLHANLFRTSLTLLGVIIGVASVVALLAIGEGSKREVISSIEAMGTNLLLVRPGGRSTRHSETSATLTRADAEAIAELPYAEAVMPERNDGGNLRFGNADYRTRITGTNESYAYARNWELSKGTFFTAKDVESYASVMVLGQTVVNSLFVNGEDPIGQYVLVKNALFEVIGTLAPKGATTWGQDMDDVVLVPVTTGAIRLFSGQHVDSISVKIDSPENVHTAEAAITELLIQRHREEDFRIRNTASFLDAVSETQNTLALLLGSVAAISLLVGGIGVMNIMLVSVTERTREIGVRMATGARHNDILLQFNIEATVVCCLGGALGIITGMAVAKGTEYFGQQVVFTPLPSLLAFGCAVTTGLVFGYLPARKAAHLDPVMALSAE